MIGTDSLHDPLAARGGAGYAIARALRTLQCCAASFLVLFAISPAHGAVEGDGAALEEIIVTAQKREQNLVEVPVAITAFNAQSLLESGIDDARDLVAFTPGFFGVATNSFLETFSIRGISTTDLGFGGDPSVAIYKDHVYQGRTGASLGQFYDMERVEVLKGPQGLLFGRNAGAGTIHLITAKPDPERTGGYAHAGAGERGVIEFDGAINLPLSDNAALRIAAFHAEEDGWIENLQGGSDRGGNDNTGGRASIGFVGERVSVTAMVEYEERQTSGTLYALVDPVSGDPYSGDVWAIDSEILDTDTDESDLLSLTLTIEYDLGFATVSSITGFKDHEFYYFEDVAGCRINTSTMSRISRTTTSARNCAWYPTTAAISPDLSARAPTGRTSTRIFRARATRKPPVSTPSATVAQPSTPTSTVSNGRAAPPTDWCASPVSARASTTAGLCTAKPLTG